MDEVMIEQQAKDLAMWVNLDTMQGFDAAVKKIATALRAAYADGQRDGMERAAKRFNKLFSADDPRIASVRDVRVDEFYQWIRQEAGEVTGG